MAPVSLPSSHPPPFFLLAFSYFLVPQNVPDSFVFPLLPPWNEPPLLRSPGFFCWRVELRGKEKTHCFPRPCTQYSEHLLLHCGHQMWGDSSTPQAILCHEVGVLRLNSILTWSTWKWCQILQVKGVVLPDSLPPHFRPGPKSRSSPVLPTHWVLIGSSSPQV